MLQIDRRVVQNFDWVFFGIVLLLILAGLVNLSSATVDGSESFLSASVRRQLFALAVGGGIMLLIVAIDYRHFEQLAIPLYGVSLFLLALTLVVAPVNRGSQAWLFQGRLQPSEFAKIGLVFALAHFFLPSSGRCDHAATRTRDSVPDHCGAHGSDFVAEGHGCGASDAVSGNDLPAPGTRPGPFLGGVGYRGDRRSGRRPEFWAQGLSAAENYGFPRSQSRSARVWLSGVAVPDCGGLGRDVGARMDGGHADSLAFPAHASHGFRILGSRRGVGVPRHHADAGFVSGHVVVGAVDRANVKGHLRGHACHWTCGYAVLACSHQCGHGIGARSGDWGAAATFFLWWLGSGSRLYLAGVDPEYLDETLRLLEVFLSSVVPTARLQGG